MHYWKYSTTNITIPTDKSNKLNIDTFFVSETLDYGYSASSLYVLSIYKLIIINFTLFFYKYYLIHIYDLRYNK